MKKTILITGSTDGIGLATAKSLLQLGHTVLIHGRSDKKLSAVKEQLLVIADAQNIYTYKADLSRFDDIKLLSEYIKRDHQSLDVLINNAGVFVVPDKVSDDGLDVRFMVNTIAPYMLTKNLLPLLGIHGRVINLSSAAQSSLNPSELLKPSILSDNAVYAKSKLALTMWSFNLSAELGKDSTMILAVNPKSFLGSKMVSQAYGVSGSDLNIGVDILVKAAISDEFANASGLYFNNDIGQFSSPHEDALNIEKTTALSKVLDEIINQHNT